MEPGNCATTRVDVCNSSRLDITIPPAPPGHRCSTPSQPLLTALEIRARRQAEVPARGVPPTAAVGLCSPVLGLGDVGHDEVAVDRHIAHVVIDYGCVISYPQPPPYLTNLYGAAGGNRAEMERGYWHHRLDYDRGVLADHQYWSLVTGRSLTAESAEVRDLVGLDVLSWSHTRPESLTVIEELADRGLQLALLSNAPAPHAEWMLAQSWSARFTHHVFSCRLGLVKPDPAIFQHAVQLLGCRPDEAVFVDDRTANCDGARAVGMGAVTFADPSDWARVWALLD